MFTKRSLLQWTVMGLALAFAFVALAAPSFAQEKARHKFFLDGNAKKRETPTVITQVIVGDKDSEGLYTILNDLWKPNFSVGTHYHATHFETFILLEGEAEWTVNGEAHKMKAGDAVYIPANATHSARTLGGKPARFILIYSSGDYEAGLERDEQLTEEQKKDPKMREMLRNLGDIHMVPQK